MLPNIAICETDAELSRRAVCDYLWPVHGQAVTHATLDNLAYLGTGPKYRTIAGRARYRVADVDAWAQARVSPSGRKASE